MINLRQNKTIKSFRRASFIKGIRSIFNISGNLFQSKISNSGKEADKKAIENDWGAIGNDIRKASKNIK